MWSDCNVEGICGLPKDSFNLHSLLRSRWTQNLHSELMRKIWEVSGQSGVFLCSSLFLPTRWQNRKLWGQFSNWNMPSQGPNPSDNFTPNILLIGTALNKTWINYFCAKIRDILASILKLFQFIPKAVRHVNWPFPLRHLALPESKAIIWT